MCCQCGKAVRRLGSKTVVALLAAPGTARLGMRARPGGRADVGRQAAKRARQAQRQHTFSRVRGSERGGGDSGGRGGARARAREQKEAEGKGDDDMWVVWGAQ